jgi:hypothetical protein
MLKRNKPPALPRGFAVQINLLTLILCDHCRERIHILADMVTQLRRRKSAPEFHVHMHCAAVSDVIKRAKAAEGKC